MTRNDDNRRGNRQDHKKSDFKKSFKKPRKFSNHKNDDVKDNSEYQKNSRKPYRDEGDKPSYKKKSYSDSDESNKSFYKKDSYKSKYSSDNDKHFNDSEKKYKNKYESSENNDERKKYRFSETDKSEKRRFDKSNDKYKKPYDSDKPKYSEDKETYRKKYKSDSDKPYKSKYGKPDNLEEKRKNRSNDEDFRERKNYNKKDSSYHDKSESEKHFREKRYSDESSSDSSLKPFKRKRIADDNSDFEYKKPSKFHDNKKESDFFEKRQKSSGYEKPYRKKSFNDENTNNNYGKYKKSDKHSDYNSEENRNSSSYDKPYRRKHDGDDSKSFEKKEVNKFYDKKKFYNNSEENRKIGGFDKPYRRKYNDDDKTNNSYKVTDSDNESIRLNKYIAAAGICSRREADILIETGAISINGVIVSELGTKVNPGDVVKYGDQILNNERKVYILLNKPKDFITTSDDPDGRKTVMTLIENACRERVYPVGRLDRATTGLLLFTNDGDLAKKLTHPKHEIRKIYHVELDKNLSKEDMHQIIEGVELEDGIAQADEIAFVNEERNKKEVGVELHSGKNRVIRRIFEQLGYDVVKLDRVYYAGLSKKDLPRGRWRFLTEMEVNMLKMI